MCAHVLIHAQHALNLAGAILMVLVAVMASAACAMLAPTIALDSLNGTNGFAIVSAESGSQTGARLARAGDLNNDGVDDMLIAAFTAKPNGAMNAGQVHV